MGELRRRRIQTTFDPKETAGQIAASVCMNLTLAAARALLVFAGLMPFAAKGQLQLSLSVQSTPSITVSSPSGTALQVHWTTNLSGARSWLHLTNFTLNSPALVSDATALGAPARFYRGVILPNANMVLVSAGSFWRGDNFNESFTDELPTNYVFTSAFFMDCFEVTRSLWNDVYLWALGHGYTTATPATGRGMPTQPIISTGLMR